MMVERVFGRLTCRIGSLLARCSGSNNTRQSAGLSSAAVSRALLEALEGRCLLSADHTAAFAGLDSAAPLSVSEVIAPIAASPKATPVAVKAAAKVSAKVVTYNTPITIRRGGVYSGNWQSLNADIPAVRIRTSEPVVIQNSNIRSAGACIDAYGYAVNLTVRNTSGYGVNPNVAGRYTGRFMDIDGFVKVSATNNYLESTGGIYLYNYMGNHTSGQSVKILRNVAKNIEGRESDGNGGWKAGAPNPDCYRQFFQINGVEGLVGAEVAWNQVINEVGKSRVEENINIHATSGTPKSPFNIHDNYIQGAYPADAIDAIDYTGGGIMLSDNGSSYIRAYRNQIVATGHIGITITSGHDNSFFENRIISSGRLPDGTVNPTSNVGGVIFNFNNESTFSNNKGYGNVIGWVGNGERNDYWVPGAASWKSNKSVSGAITRKVEAAEWSTWLKKLAKGGVVVGPQTK